MPTLDSSRTRYIAAAEISTLTLSASSPARSPEEKLWFSVLYQTYEDLQQDLRAARARATRAGKKKTSRALPLVVLTREDQRELTAVGSFLGLAKDFLPRMLAAKPGEIEA
jgi:hypothetical protein